MERSLREMRIRGVKTNIPFLVNVMRNEKFRSGDYTTKFIEETPELFDIAPTLDRGTKTLEYIGNVTINGFPNVENVRSQTMSQLRFRKFQKENSKSIWYKTITR